MEFTTQGEQTPFTVCADIATLRVRHSYLRRKVGHAQNI